MDILSCYRGLMVISWLDQKRFSTLAKSFSQLSVSSKEQQERLITDTLRCLWWKSWRGKAPGELINPNKWARNNPNDCRLLFMPQNKLEYLKVRLLRSVTLERGNSFVHQQSVWSAVGDDITGLKLPAASFGLFDRILEQLQSTFSGKTIVLRFWKSTFCSLGKRVPANAVATSPRIHQTWL